MVSVRLVDSPPSPEEQGVRPIPNMMFAVGEEPVGVRVLTYLSSGAINRICNALEEEEIQIIEKSSFRKILEIGEKPVFSGRFARYILSRQLKTQKKHEAWFRFAGKPIRFSLREFAIVTGLPCGKFPMKSKLKLKATISEKPYWPSLFGKIDVVTVSSVIKMLRRRTVKERVIRIKYACLALLSSVLLPTNLKMKICKEHAEAIADLDEFFSYPWGRLAFDMLMGSIKERDEIALSQNTIAVKGFALALQLVMVEAVPSLTEVVQETCSSSESDSEEEVDDMRHKRKKQTLSPGHARTVDKLPNVVVKSIIDQDPLRPVDESNLGWSDEEDDEKVDNMLYLINNNYQFNTSMFLGGVTKVDVDRMRESVNCTSKAKKLKKQSVIPPAEDSGYIASLVIEKIKPEFHTMEGNIKKACMRVDSMEGSLVGLVQSMLVKFKEEMLDSVRCLVTEFSKDDGPAPLRLPQARKNIDSGENGEDHVSNGSPLLDANNETIRNILGNLSSYSTPPQSPRLSQAENYTPTNNKAGFNGADRVAKVSESVAPSAHSQTHHSPVDINLALEVDNRLWGPITEMPSFSLGLTQDEQLNANRGSNMKDVVGDVPQTPVPDADNHAEHQQYRRSKRHKSVPQALVDDYHCGREIVSRVRKSQKFIFILHDRNEINRKYARLSAKFNPHFPINVAGHVVSANDIQQIGERSRFLAGKVVDILIGLAQCIIQQHIPADTQERTIFLDSKYVSAIGRTYPKFSKARNKESFKFPTGMVQLFNNVPSDNIHRSRYYYPVNVGKKLWVGICVDNTCGKITVLDCNATLFTDAMMEKHLHAHVLMLPYLLRLSNQGIGVGQAKRLAVERPKGVSQTLNPSDSGLMCVLLMATHAIYGIEACKNINNDILVDEGKSAAIMAFEFNSDL